MVLRGGARRCSASPTSGSRSRRRSCSTAGPPCSSRARTSLVLAALLVAARRTDPADRAVFTGFYMFVWKLFFLEYVIVPLAWLLA